MFEARAAVRGTLRVLGEEKGTEEHLKEHLRRVHVGFARLKPLLGLVLALLLACLICSTRCKCMVSWGLRHLKTGERRGVSSGVASYLSQVTFCDSPHVPGPPRSHAGAPPKSPPNRLVGSSCCKFVAASALIRTQTRQTRHHTCGRESPPNRRSSPIDPWPAASRKARRFDRRQSTLFSTGRWRVRWTEICGKVFCVIFCVSGFGLTPLPGRNRTAHLGGFLEAVQIYTSRIEEEVIDGSRVRVLWSGEGHQVRLREALRGICGVRAGGFRVPPEFPSKGGATGRNRFKTGSS